MSDGVRDMYAKLLPGYPLAEMSALIERHAERTGLLAIPQFFTVGSVALEGGAEYPSTPLPFRYTAAKALDDWQASPGAGISFIVRWFDPAEPDAMAAYQHHKDAQATEREQMGLKP